MIYTKLIATAARIAYDAHAGQFDKGGLPYILHPLHLAEQMTTEDECVVALLHDVLEDTDLTPEDLSRQGITDSQIASLKLLLHDKAVPYLAYVEGLRGDPVARNVKIADLRHNSDLTRLGTISPGDVERAGKYQAALEILTKGETTC